MIELKRRHATSLLTAFVALEPKSLKRSARLCEQGDVFREEVRDPAAVEAFGAQRHPVPCRLSQVPDLGRHSGDMERSRNIVNVKKPRR